MFDYQRYFHLYVKPVCSTTNICTPFLFSLHYVRILVLLLFGSLPHSAATMYDSYLASALDSRRLAEYGALAGMGGMGAMGGMAGMGALGGMAGMGAMGDANFLIIF